MDPRERALLLLSPLEKQAFEAFSEPRTCVEVAKLCPLAPSSIRRLVTSRLRPWGILFTAGRSGLTQRFCNDALKARQAQAQPRTPEVLRNPTPLLKDLTLREYMVGQIIAGRADLQREHLQHVVEQADALVRLLRP